MKRTMRIFLISIALSIAIISCSESGDNARPQSSMLKVAETDSLFFIDQSGYNLSLVIPKTSVAKDARFWYKENFGEVELYVHPKFHVHMSMDNTSLEDLKKELEDNEVFKYKFYDEQEEELLYQSVLPDGTELGFQWVKRIDHENRPMLIKTDLQKDFNKQNIREIQECLSTLEVSHK